MPPTRVLAYREADGRAPVLEWLERIGARNERAFANCLVRVRRLAAMGYELRRPEADSIGGGLHELRVREGRVQYRILYFFHGRSAVVLAHGLVKEDAVPRADIERAMARRRAFEKDPALHTH